MIETPRCPECGGETIPNPRPELRMPQYLCGNPGCHMCEEEAERVFLTRAILRAAYEWRHVSDDATLGEDDEALGEKEEKLARAVDAFTTRFPGEIEL